MLNEFTTTVEAVKATKWIEVTFKGTDYSEIMKTDNVALAIECYESLGHKVKEYTPDPEAMALWQMINCTK